MRVFLLLLTLAFSWSARADDGLLDALSRQAAATTLMEGRFTQEKHLTILPKPVVSSGHFSFDHKRGIVWETLKPIVSKFSVGPDGINGGQLPNSAAARSKQIETLFLSLVTGDFRQLEQLFSVTAEGNIQSWQLLLKPQNNNVQAYIKAIHVAGGENSENITIEEQNGDSTRITLDLDRIERQPSAKSQ